MNSPEFIQELKTLIGSFPIASVPRPILKRKRLEIKLHKLDFRMQQKILRSLQQIYRFGEPMEDHGTDGCE